MLIGTMKGHEIHDREDPVTGEPRATPSWCYAPDGSAHGSSEHPCSHLNRIYAIARAGSIPEELRLTPDGARAARACKCLAGRYRPPRPKTPPPPPAPAGENAEARRARERAGKRLAWELGQDVERAYAAADRSRRAETAADARVAAAEASLAAAEAYSRADAAQGTPEGAGALRTARKAARMARLAGKIAKIDAILERLHAKDEEQREKRRARDAKRRERKAKP